jgi:hypothetical protein
MTPPPTRVHAAHTCSSTCAPCIFTSACVVLGPSVHTRPQQQYACPSIRPVPATTCPCVQGIPRPAYKDKKRLLKRLEKEAGVKQEVAREKRITKKYHKVRFVDKKKVTRKLEQTRKRIKALVAAGQQVRVLRVGVGPCCAWVREWVRECACVPSCV